MERRSAKVTLTKVCGNASAGAVKYRVSLPTNWSKRMGLDDKNREVSLSFDGKRIIIEKI